MGDLLLESGVVDQRIPFYLGSLLTGLSAFTVYAQKGTSAAVAMTTPDVVEDGTVPGLYRLLLDEQTVITAGKTTESLGLLIQCPGMPDLFLRVVLYSNLKADMRKVIGNTLVVGGGDPASPIGI